MSRRRDFGDEESPTLPFETRIDESYVQSKAASRLYANIQILLGILGLLFPIIFVLFSFLKQENILPSISDYYFTNLNIWFEGVIFTIGIYLITYSTRGKGEIVFKSFRESHLYFLAGIFAFGIIFFPTGILHEQYVISADNYENLSFEIFNAFYKPHLELSNYKSVLHYVSAASFFAILSYLVSFRFGAEGYSEFNPNDWRKEIEVKKPRFLDKNYKIIFKVLGSVMFLSIIAIAFMKFIIRTEIDFQYTFWLELVALICFGLAWLLRSRHEIVRLKYFFRQVAPSFLINSR